MCKHVMETAPLLFLSTYVPYLEIFHIFTFRDH